MKPLSRKRTGLLATGAVLIALGLLVSLALTPDIPLQTLLPQYTDQTSRFLDLNGARVHYRDQGQGPALVLLHGTGASLHTWDAWTAVLSPHFRVLRMDLPGFGLTGPTPTADYSVQAYVGFLESFRQALGLERFALAGNSLGGHIGWAFALAHPDEVTELILVDPAGFPIAHPAVVFRLARIPLLSRLLTALDPGPMVRRSLRDAYGDPRRVRPELRQRYRDLALRAGNRGAFVDRAQQTEPDRTAELPRIKARTLVMWGDQDRLIPPTDADRFVRAIPGAQLVLYPGVGHVPMEEIGERSGRDAQAFLAGRPIPR